MAEKQADEIFCPSCGGTIKKEAELCPKCGVPKSKWRSAEEVFCTSCGEKIKREAEICPKCGVRQITGTTETTTTTGSSKSKWGIAGCLAFFLGNAGVHRFYTGKIGLGILTVAILIISMFLTSFSDTEAFGWVIIAGLTVWSLIDFFLILKEKYKDKSGNIIKKDAK
jgi:TM2 domain-containing membrane protein YozV/RNA polymerase subunit RPABC4/transcription elongation factor Spt4